MGKKETREIFRRMLDKRMELMKQAVQRKSDASALMMYGQICGVVDSMKVMGLIDYEQAEYIKNEARMIRLGKEPDYEAC
ncbi:MAG: hypothetical protein MJ074_06800 [Oscillospiraceae bacterium]|nr:hypothetical protein [Oscillospiraceae bacterium]